MKPNIGLINALVRITVGLTVVSWSTAKLVRKPYRSMPLIVAMLGAMKVAEGITRFCPLTYLFEERFVEVSYMDDDDYYEDYDIDEDYEEYEDQIQQNMD